LERKLTAILCADVFGYSRLMGEDEEATLRTLTSHRNLIDSQIEQHHGRFVNSAGDSVLAEFASVVEAVNCAVDIQTGLKAENASIPPELRMEFRIGVNLGDVMVEGAQIYGDGVNVAARLESLAEPGGICISNTVHDQVSTKLALNYADLGEQAVKNIAKPVRVYRVLLNGTVAPRRVTRGIPRRDWRVGAFSFVGIAILVGMFVLVQRVSLKPQPTHASIPPQENPALPLPNIPSIAVLPFANLGGDPQQDYFSDGISDQLINQLSRLPGLFVIARNSSFSYKGKATNEHEIGNELGVKYLLEGSTLRSPDRVRIGVELVDAGTGAEMWAERYDRPLKDIFTVQDEIVDKVVATLGLFLKVEEMGLPHAGPSYRTSNLDAYDDLLRAVEADSRFTKDGNARARQWAEKVVELDPQFSEGYQMLGATYFEKALFRWSEDPREDLERSSELAQKALTLDDSNVYALSLLSNVDWMQRRFNQAVADGERAVAINPNYAAGYAALADALNVSNRPEQAFRAAQKALRLDPSGQDFYTFLAGSALVLMGQYKQAILLLKRHVRHYPDQVWAHVNLAVAYMELGREHEARDEVSEIVRISPQFVLGNPSEDESVNRLWETDLRKAGLK
jgi:adenylate cyclase